MTADGTVSAICKIALILKSLCRRRCKERTWQTESRRPARHVSQNEGLIFEKSAPGKRGIELPPLDVPAVDAKSVLGADYLRDGVDGFPEVSEIEVIRHFTRLSTWNYAIDLGMYPLGSCTMKYNPRVNEFIARLDGIATEHPYQPQELSQGCLKILATLEKCLLEITGMDAATLQPAAGAQGELTGLLLIRAYLESRAMPRKKVLIPDSAHGTNPATAVIAGYEVENIRSDARGQIDVEQLQKHRERRRGRAHGHQSFDARDIRAAHRRSGRSSALARRAALYGWRQHERARRRGAGRAISAWT